MHSRYFPIQIPLIFQTSAIANQMKIKLFLILLGLCFEIHAQQIDFKNLENINSVDEVFHAQGLLSASFFVNADLALFDIRISRGINPFIDGEIKKAIRSMDTSVLRCAVNETELQQVWVLIRL
jgi:hypothetical protein